MTSSSVRGRVAAAAILVAAAVSGGAAQAPPRSEYEIKAAYLFTFGRFIEWPERPSRDEAGFSICVLGSDPFGAVLDSTLAGATLRGRKVVARRIATPKLALDCHILFISGSEERRLDAVVQALDQAGVLTVSDMPQFVARGGMIQFVTAGSRIRFEINLPPARDAGLTMGSELLRVASAVRSTRQPGE